MRPPVEPRVLPILLAGDRLDRFCLSSKLGEGATSIVFAAHDESCHRSVALKILKQVADPAHRRRFLREGRIAAAMTHRNLAEIFEVIDTSGCSLIVMELVRGTTLRARLKDAAAAGGGLSHGEALWIAQQICRGLATAHRTGVVHCDIKPENVMLSHFGEVKLLDFGIAKMCFAADQPPESTDTQTWPHPTEEAIILGTPGYMSPEQGRGEPLDGRADLFSLGVLLYEMLAATRPFTGRAMHDVMLAVERAQPEPPSRHRHSPDPMFDRMLDRVVLRCLEKSPQARHGNAYELLYELQVLSHWLVSH
jgi:serine/threonine protein kinase